MKIECIRYRANGTEVELDGETYHFKPTATDPRHIAEVSKIAHIKTLLAIEAYQVADEAVAEMTGTKKAKTVADAVTTPAPAAATTEAGAQGDDTTPAPDGEDQTPEQETDPDGNAPTGETPTGATVELDDLTDAQLRAAYQATLGKAPGGTKRPKLIEALKAAGYVHTA